MKTIILLSGKQGSGKTTIQKTLVKNYERMNFNSVSIVNFADTLYELQNLIYTKMNQVDPNIILKSKDGLLLQLLGTEWARKTFGEDIWVNILKSRISRVDSQMRKSRNLFIIGDCRFKNEFDGFGEALRVRLKASREIRKTRTDSWRDNENHESEISLDEYENKFDLILNTEEGNKIESNTELIMAQIMKNTWQEKRKC